MATGELEQITDAKGNLYSFAYDGLGRQTLEHDADRGAWHMSYDANGNLIRRRDANQNITRTEFDALNRQVRVVTQENEHTVYTYDVGDNAVGRVVSVVTPDMVRGYHYDARGRTLAQSMSMDGHDWATSFTYDDADRLAATTYPDGEVVRTSYDARGFVKRVAGDDTYVVGTAYTDYGKMTRLSYGNGTHLVYSYYDGSAVDPLSGSAHSYRLRAVSADGGTVSLSLEYQYDKSGNVLALIDRADEERTQHFAYDSADRLI